MIEYKNITEFEPGTLLRLLIDGYSFNPAWRERFEPDWIEFDRFFYGNPKIADSCGFMTVLDGAPIGFVTWDPRKKPEFVIGHNCIATAHKGKGCGKAQLSNAVGLIRQSGARLISVTTSGSLTAAQHMYESVGFRLKSVRENTDDAFSGAYMDYILNLQD